jgi:hypothetical protein
LLISNPLPIELQIDFLNLLAEYTTTTTNNSKSQQQDTASDRVSISSIKSTTTTTTNDLNRNLFRIKLFKLNAAEAAEIRLPAKTADLKLTMGFQYDALEKFKLIGYELGSLKCKSEIYFKEIASSKTSEAATLSKRLNNTADLTGVQGQYEVEMIPKLPVIKSISFCSCDYNSNRQSRPLADSDPTSDSKIISLNVQLGKSELFLVDLKLDNVEEPSVDLDILEYRLITQNEALANKLAASLSLTKEKETEFRLKIDSTQFQSDALLDSTELELANWLEIKYTSKLGQEANQCYIYRQQLNVKFTQVIFYSLVDCRDLDEAHFEMTLLIRNLTGQRVLIHGFKAAESVELDKESVELKLTLDKLDLSKSQNYLAQINESLLNLSYSLMDDSTHSAIRFSSNNQTEAFRKLLTMCFKCPVEFKAIVSNCEPPGTKTSLERFQTYKFMLVARNRTAANNGLEIQVKFKLNVDYLLVSNDLNWILKV